jgi:acyl-CoA synthetase (AMP-forming)/AMP-acid ligase II
MPETTVAAVLRAQARRRGDHPLLVCDAERLSYAETERRSAHLARGLLALGTGKGTHIGVLYPNGPEFIVAMLAAARFGAIVIPFSTFATAPEMATQLAHADVEILLATASYRGHDYRERLADIDRSAVPLLRHVLIESEPTNVVDEAHLHAMESDVDPSDPLAIVYTSGSTSAPKGAVHTHASLLEHQRVLNAIRGLTADDKLFCNSPFFWIGGIAFSVLATLVAGATLVCSNAVDGGKTLDLLEAEKPTMTNGFVGGITHLTRHPSLPDPTCPPCGAETCTPSCRPMCGLPILSCGTPCSA